MNYPSLAICRQLDQYDYPQSGSQKVYIVTPYGQVRLIGRNEQVTWSDEHTMFAAPDEDELRAQIQARFEITCGGMFNAESMASMWIALVKGQGRKNSIDELKEQV